ncbi:MAG: hypothetical protein ACLSVD_02265 [Eggerthellaceae bacterium]
MARPSCTSIVAGVSGTNSCGICVDACPYELPSTGRPPVVDAAKCNGCGECVKICRPPCSRPSAAARRAASKWLPKDVGAREVHDEAGDRITKARVATLALVFVAVIALLAFDLNWARLVASASASSSCCARRRTRRC